MHLKNREVCEMSEGVPIRGMGRASNKGILRISTKKKYKVIAYKLTKDLNRVYNKKSIYLRWVTGLNE